MVTVAKLNGAFCGIQRVAGILRTRTQEIVHALPGFWFIVLLGNDFQRRRLDGIERELEFFFGLAIALAENRRADSNKVFRKNRVGSNEIDFGAASIRIAAAVNARTNPIAWVCTETRLQ